MFWAFLVPHTEVEFARAREALSEDRVYLLSPEADVVEPFYQDQG